MSAGNAKIEAAVGLEALFDGYQVTVTPEEALELLHRLPALGKAIPATLETLVREINAAVPELDLGTAHPKTGQPGHRYHIGRFHGRLIIIELFEGYLPKGRDSEKLAYKIAEMAERAGCRTAHVDYDEHYENDTSVMIRTEWD